MIKQQELAFQKWLRQIASNPRRFDVEPPAQWAPALVVFARACFTAGFVFGHGAGFAKGRAKQDAA